MVNFKTIALAGVSAIAISGAAHAQQGPAASDRTLEEVVVTGSRIVRNGYEAPTPVTVLSVENLQQAAPTNIPDGLNQLPQFQLSRGVAGAQPLTNANLPAAGNYLNLRGVGETRVLILQDGRRVPPTTFEGSVDTNIIPQALVQRVDVVTAGASAVYGADAVSGVVNFVIDTKFDGLKGTIQAGETEYGDAEHQKFSIAGGRPLFGGRGHIVASFDHYRNDGIPKKGDRPYLLDPNNAYFAAGTGTANDPFRTVTGARNITFLEGGLILGVQGPTGAFNPAGASLFFQRFPDSQTMRPLVIGAPTGTSGINIGGEGNLGSPTTTGAATLRTDQAFVHGRYDLTDDITVFAQGSYAEARNTYNAQEQASLPFNPPTIFAGNPYIPVPLRNIMQATGTSGVQLTRVHTELPPAVAVTDNKAGVFVAGVEGKLEAFGRNLNWDIAYTHGESRLHTRQAQIENQKFFGAVDAVVDPANGQIVCRVTLVNPSLLPGCVPINLFGPRSISPAGAAYVTGYSVFEVENKLDQVEANLAGEAFDTWAGPVSFNVGANWRSQTLKETSNGDPNVPVDFTGIRGVPGAGRTRFNFTNVGTATGEYDVKEAYGEVVVPLAKDLAFAKLLELNGAVRYTDYSTSGEVTTWKIGLNWEPVAGLRLRATRSKDIRAPTLYDLFAGRQINPVTFTDTGRTNTTGVVQSIGGGNADLKPEIGHTTSIGVVFQPDWLEGFSASVDYYDLEIEDAIGAISIDAARNQCAASGGGDPLCARFVRATPGSYPSQYLSGPINIAKLQTRGWDLEAAYRRDLSDFNQSLKGVLSLRALFNYVPRYRTNAGGGARTIEAAGTVGRSRWRGTVSADYRAGPFDGYLQARIVGPAERDNQQFNRQYYVDNKVDAQVYWDASVNYEVEISGRTFTPFLTINNLLDRKAPILPTTFIAGVLWPTDAATYDIYGRRYTAGVRFNF